jgi:hypothetical protein
LNKTPLLILSWVITFIVCFWGLTLFVGLTCSKQPSPRSPVAGAHKEYEWYGESQKRHQQQNPGDLVTASGHIIVTETTEKEGGDSTDDNFNDSLYRWIVAWDTNRTVAFFTAFAALSAFLQYLVTQSTLAANRAETRAYVSFSLNLNPDHDPQANQPYIMVFNCANCGKTAAKNIGFRGGIWLIPFPYERSGIPEIGPGLDEQRGNLFPGENMSDKGLGFSANTQSVFTWPQIVGVMGGRNAFIIGLKIWYLDVFEQPHETVEYWAIHYAPIPPPGAGFVRRVSMLPGKSRIT